MAKFEDRVIELYRLLGAQIKQNITIRDKKVDILATFRLPGSSTKHRVIVECKDESRPIAQNQFVTQFQGLLAAVRKGGDADSAEIITRVRWSDQAKEFALRSGIQLLTYTEKISQLIDLSTYLKDTVSRFDKQDPRQQSEQPLGAYYVDLSAERFINKETEKIPVIDTYVQEWLDDRDTHKQLAILGEYGMGKSSFCQKLAHDLAASYIQEPGSTRIPIILNLHKFTKILKIKPLVLSFLDEECGVRNPRFELFEVMNEAGLFVLIFDGFDEMAVRVDQETLEKNLQEMEKLAASHKAKVIITSIPKYFPTTKEQEMSLSPAGRLFAKRQIEYEPLHIVPWEEPHINLFLQKKVPLVEKAKRPWTYYRDRIREIGDLSDLSRRPILLNMIVKTLPELISKGRPINRSNLYEAYLEGEIRRQKIPNKRKLLLTDAARFSLLRHLSLDFYTGKINNISFGDAMTHMEQLVKSPKAQLKAYTQDFLTRSILMRKYDEYYFSHKSIMEYLVAQALKKEIENDSPSAFGRDRLESPVTAFLSEMDVDRDTLLRWIRSTKSTPNRDIPWLGGNAATLLCKLDATALKCKNLSGTILNGAIFDFADLTGTIFNGAILKNVSFRGTKFLENTLLKSSIRDIVVVIYWLEGYSSMVGRPTSSLWRRLEKMPSIYLLAGLWRPISQNLAVAMTRVQVPNVSALDALRKKIENFPEIQATAVFTNEIDGLAKMVPNNVCPDFRRFVHQSTSF